MLEDVTFRPDLLYNMLITGVIGFVSGIVVGWFGHVLASRRDRRNWKWQELQYWRNRVVEIERKITDIDPRSPGAIQLARMESDGEVKWPHGASKVLIEEARDAKRKIKTLEGELGIK